jgi:hypothetical protein
VNPLKRKREERRAELKTIRKSQKPSSKTTRGLESQRKAAQIGTKQTQVGRVEQSIELAKNTLKQAENLSKSFGAKIMWGDKTYDLGSTKGYKEYRQALRDKRSEINKVENQLKRYKTAASSAAAAKLANVTIEKANIVIAKAEKITTPKISKAAKSRYQRQVDSQVDFMAQLVAADVVDKSQAKKLVKELTPIAAGSVTTEDHAEKVMIRVDNKLKYYEKLADYEKDIGIEELTGPDKKQNINKVKARLAHMTMSTAIGFTASVPIAVLGVTGGPAVGGVIAAASVATLANPESRAELNQYIANHPQEFLGGLGGALLAGATVSQVNKAFKTYTKDMKLKDRRGLQKEWDKLIDDIHYAEQHRGAEFPSKVVESLEPEGWIQYVKDSPYDEWEQYVARQVLKNSPREDTATWLMKQKKIQFMYGPSVSRLQPTLIEDLIAKHPELREPYFNPALTDPNILNKADIVARSNVKGINYSPLLAAALAEAASKGYITDEDIKRLIKENNKVIEQLKQQGVQIAEQFSLQELVELSIADVAEIVDQTPDQDIIQLPDIIQKPIAEQETEEIVIPVPEPPGTTPDVPPDTPEPLEPTPPLKLSLGEKKKRKEMNLRFYMGPRAIWAVKYGYPRGKGDSVTVEARSLPDAMNTAQRIKPPKRYLPNFVDIKLLKVK